MIRFTYIDGGVELTPGRVVQETPDALTFEHRGMRVTRSLVSVTRWEVLP